MQSEEATRHSVLEDKNRWLNQLVATSLLKSQMPDVEAFGVKNSQSLPGSVRRRPTCNGPFAVSPRTIGANQFLKANHSRTHVPSGQQCWFQRGRQRLPELVDRFGVG